MGPMSSESIPFVRRLALRNYKSIAICDVALAPLTVLVGRNGSGKSNFLDGLHFVVDALQGSLDQAIKSRGGIDAVRRRSTGHPRNFAIALDFAISSDETASYAFEITARPNGSFAVKTERLSVHDRFGRRIAFYQREEGQIIQAALTASGTPIMPPVLEDRLYLVNAAGLPEFRPAFDALLSMGFYNLNPESMKEIQGPDAGELLHSDGANIASVVSRLSVQEPERLERIREYLATIVPGIEDVNRVSLGPKETLMFQQTVDGARNPWRFYASSMSDGTLRTLGALVATTQISGERNLVRLVGIEEPETALHPAAAGALMDALREAATRTQVIITTHSADLLDQLNEDDALLLVSSRNGTSRISLIDSASRDAIRQHLYSPGEMLRMDQLQPDDADIERQEQLRLFEPASAPS